MSLKTRLRAAKTNITTFIKEDGKLLATAALVSTLGTLVYVVRQHTNMLDEIKDTINQNAGAANYNNQNPWYLEGGDPAKAKRVHLEDETILTNPYE